MNGDKCGEKVGTRIFKKSTPNGKITIYLGKRDFFDHLSHVDPIEGVILVDPDYVKDRKVFVHLHGSFRYGQDEGDLFGLAYQSDLYYSAQQLYPPPVLPLLASSHQVSGSSSIDPPSSPTRLQERLMRKLGPFAYPFYFQLPTYSPSSVTVHTVGTDTSKPCRVDYELKVYVADNQDDKAQRRNSVRMAIRKLTYAPEKPGPQPSIETCRDFLMSIGSLRAEVSLDKMNYHHGEIVCVNVLVDNNSNRSVKKIKLSLRQCAQLTALPTVSFKTVINELQSDDGFPILPCQTGWCKVYQLHPKPTNVQNKLGIAMDGDLKQESTNLASSTICPSEQNDRTSLGIVISYKVKVRLILGFGVSDICLELPFTLTHANPEDCSLSLDDFQDDLEQPVFDDVSTHSQSSPMSHTTTSPHLPNSRLLRNKTHESNGASGVYTVSRPLTTTTASSLTIRSFNGHDRSENNSLVNSTTSKSLLPFNNPETSMGNPFHSPLMNHPVNVSSISADRQMVSEDDLIFADFARLRLRTVMANH